MPDQLLLLSRALVQQGDPMQNDILENPNFLMVPKTVQKMVPKKGPNKKSQNKVPKKGLKKRSQKGSQTKGHKKKVTKKSHKKGPQKRSQKAYKKGKKGQKRS